MNAAITLQSEWNKILMLISASVNKKIPAKYILQIICNWSIHLKALRDLYIYNFKFIVNILNAE